MKHSVPVMVLVCGAVLGAGLAPTLGQGAAKPVRETLTSGAFTMELPLGLPASAAHVSDAHAAQHHPRAPYMHDGSDTTLRDVILFYRRGGTRNQWLDKDMKPLGLTQTQIDDLIAFMEALTGDVTNTVPPAALPK